MTKGMTVLAIGPGLGQSDDTARFCIGLLEATKMPVVIDADGLNILSKHADVLARLTSDGRTMVMTPHPGEMARLAGISTAEVQANRLEVARDFARQNGVTLVLKGARTLIAHPDGSVAVNTTGNPGMAKGGSGDVLTGMVAGLLAQYKDEPQARWKRRFICTAWLPTWRCASGRAHAAGDGQPSVLFSGISLSLPYRERLCLVAGAASGPRTDVGARGEGMSPARRSREAAE